MGARSWGIFGQVSDDLRTRVREAAAWCALRFDPARPATSLRTELLRPAGFGWPYAEPLARARGGVTWRLAERSAGECMRVVDVLAARRRAALDAASPGWSRAEASRGRLLRYDAANNLCDGAAEVETDGFLDLENAPPWDTWVAYVLNPDAPEMFFRAYLLAWVPEAMVAAVARGIAVNPEECIAWGP